jgi:type I restriction enzyme, S subunit
MNVEESTIVKKKSTPSGWIWTTVGEIATLKNGINFTKNEKGTKGIPTIDVLNMYSDSPYVKLDNVYRVDKKYSDDYILKDGDILFVRSSVKREGVGWATLFRAEQENITFCGFIIRARLLTVGILPSYLIYYLRSKKVRKEIIDSSSQVTITNINQLSLSKIKIPLAPFSEQKRMVSKIEELFSQIDKSEEFIKKIFGVVGEYLIKRKSKTDKSEIFGQFEKLREGILQKAFDGDLVPQNSDDETLEKILEKLKQEKEQLIQKQKESRRSKNVK